MTDRKGHTKTLRRALLRGLCIFLIAAALAAGAFSLRTAALTHLGVIAKAPAIEFEIRMPQTVAKDDLKQEAQVELLTDLNQTLAQLDGTLRATEDGRAVLRGHVPLKFRTTERVVVLSLPGQAQRAFRLRLPPNPSPSDEFGPWHMTDRITPTGDARVVPDDSFAIRYRVLRHTGPEFS